MSQKNRLIIRGVAVYPEFLDVETQVQMMGEVMRVIDQVPLVHPMTRWGKKMSVGMTSAGQVGWVSTSKGYRYVPTHASGRKWPAIPPSILRVWQNLVPEFGPPDSCLINHYSASARMGMHQDRDEADFHQPVVSISLGDQALFRIGNATRGGKTESLWLSSGDVAVLAGEARLIYHGIDRLRAGSSDLVPLGGRFNITLRVAGRPTL